MTDIENLLKKRREIKKRKPDFIRSDSHKKKKLGDRWVRPRGIHSKLRLRKGGHRKAVSPGFRSPARVRGFDRSGLRTIFVSNCNLQNIDPKKHAILISGAVGIKKRVGIIKEAQSRGIKILNVKNAELYIKNAEEMMKKRKEEKVKGDKEKKEKEKKMKVEEKKEKETDKGIEKAITEEERKEEEKKKKEDEKKEKDKVLTKKT